MVKKELVEELTASKFPDFIKKEKIAVVDFYAEWCFPCTMMAPIIESLAAKMPKVRFAKINIDDSRELAEKYKIRSIPCIIFFKNEKEVDRVIGAIQEDFLERKIRELE